jgi:RHS repeat-associated protein
MGSSSSGRPHDLPNASPCNPDCGCGCGGGSGSAPAVSNSPAVRYLDGEVQYEVSDFEVGGFGGALGNDRVYSNQYEFHKDFGIGYNWQPRAWPYLTDSISESNAVVYVNSTREVIWFDRDPMSGVYTARHGAKHTLTLDSTSHVFTLTKEDGSVEEFHDFTQTTNPQGLLKKIKTPGGQEITVTSYTSGKIGEIQRSATVGSDTITESLKYDYFTSGDQNGRLQYVTLRRKVNSGSWSELRRVEHEYYGSSEDNGSLGDLKRVKVQALVGSTWTDMGIHYYRYYKSGNTNGGAHLIKFILEPEAYQRLDDAVSDPTTASDTTVGGYADYYYEYDSSNRVTKEKTHGGSKTFTFTFTTSSHADDYNNWKRKAVETLPDGTQNLIYTNYIGQSLVSEHKSGSDRWIEHRKYDSAGRLIQRATPAAVTGYDDTQANLAVTLRSSDGLIRVTDYYTTTGSGAAAGYVQHEKIKKGENGTARKLRTFEYTSQTAGGVAIYPVSKETVYRNDDDTGAIDTTFSYVFHSGTVRIQKRTTTLPAISTSQNGSGTSNTREEVFDVYGNLEWVKDERGAITRLKYDLVKGAMTQMIQDVDTTQTSDEPSGWSTVSGFGLHLVSDYEVDDLGRATQALGPSHNVDISGTDTTVRTAEWTVYKDVDHEVWSGRGYGSGSGFSTYTLVNPVSITKMDRAGRPTDQISATRASTSGKLSASDTFAQSSWVRWSKNTYDDSGDLTASRVYHTIPSSGSGSSGTNYDETTFGYETMGRQNKHKTPGGTITRTVFDVRGRVQKVYVGTNDTGATESDPTGGGASGNNMVLVTEHEYDSGSAGANGNLTKTTQYVDGSTTRVTNFGYDWRDRQISIDGEVDFYQENTFDNLDRVTKVERKNTTSSGNLIARSETFFDDLGRVYQTKRYAVNVSTGSVGNALTDNTWFDEAGNVIKQKPAGSEAFTKSVYDGLGRQTKRYIGYDTAETSYSDAKNVTGDTIFEQVETSVDAASNVIETRLRRRHHDATGTGELTTPLGSQPKARVSYMALWPDAIGREQALANYGTNGDLTLSRPTTIPVRSDTVLVTTTFYNDDGEGWKSIDPAGRDDRVYFDDGGRRTKTIENYDDGDPTTGAADKDRTVEYTYNADGLVKTIKARQQSTSDDQVTKYVYGTTLTDSDIARSDLLRSEIYPDSDDVDSPLGDGADSTYDRVEYKYNRQGERKEKKDQNGSVHVFEFDKLGRVLHDRVTTLASGVNGAVRRISTTYEVRGLVEKITSYDNATVGSGSVANEVLRDYNDLGLLTKEHQEHEGAKDANTLYVGYTYDDTASSGEFTKGLRLKSVRYPNGRLVHYTYSSSGSAADNLARLDAIKDDSGGSPGSTLSSYTYLGLGMIVVEDYEEPDVKLDYFGGTSSSYAGFDRFDRVVDQRWLYYGATPNEDRDRYLYGYDRASNRTYRENNVSKNLSTPIYLDEFYAYDGLHRLKNFDRGQLNGTKTGITGTPSKEEDWSLDPLGNWSNYVQKTSGTTDLNQNRSVNKVNELSDISETVGPSWASPVYDRNGNMTTIPKPADLTAGLTGKYDAWNRFVEVKDGTTVIGVYEYDGLMRRIKKHIDSQAPSSPNGLDKYEHRFFTTTWQLLETREAPAESDEPESLQPTLEYVWSARYIDAPILRDKNTDTDSLCDDERLYFASDSRMDTEALLTITGAVVERYLIDAYGNAVIYDASWTTTRSTSLYGNSVVFSGHECDPETRLMDFRTRPFATAVGAFLRRDDAHYNDGYNLYCAYFVPANTDPIGTVIVFPDDAEPFAGILYKRWSCCERWPKGKKFPIYAHVCTLWKSAQSQCEESTGYVSGDVLFVYPWTESDPCPARGLGPPDLFYVMMSETLDACGCSHADIAAVNQGFLRMGAGGNPVRIVIGARPIDDNDVILRREWTGQLKSGPGAGKPCKKATSADIAACVRLHNTGIVGGGVSPNCQTDVELAAAACCLTGFTATDLRPRLFA